MSSIQDIETAFDAAAKAEWATIKSEAIVVEQEFVADVKTVFATLAVQFAPLVMSTISNIATDIVTAKLSGSEKTNLATTSLIDKAAQSGVAILAEDASGLIKLGFEHFKDAAETILAPVAAAAPAVGELASKALDAGETAVEGAVTDAAASASKSLGGDGA